MRRTCASPAKLAGKNFGRRRMKLTTPQIVWHGKEPVFSADFHRSEESWRLATGGADKDVKIWRLVQEDEGRVRPVFMASLTRHSGAINVVRFSPNGELLASAGDDNVVCLWKMDEGGGANNTVSMDTGGLTNKESWNISKMLRGHVGDIYDACWSIGSNLLVTGSVDNTAIVWDVSKGQALCTLKDSKQYVQGVAWDPIGRYLATFSNDRYLRIYLTDAKYRCVHSVNKMATPDKDKVGGGSSQQFRMWIDESLSFFFRRLTFSTDGNLLVVPAGRFENGDKVTNMTYIFTRSDLTKPAVCLPCPEKATVVVKFCPKLFKLRDSIEKEKSLFSLPYRMVYAVASLDAVLLYDTQQATPFAYLGNIHYSGITDLAWSDDGLVLVVTSSDAYCSIVTFEPGELGITMATEDLPEWMRQKKLSAESGKTMASSADNKHVRNDCKKLSSCAATKETSEDKVKKLTSEKPAANEVNERESPMVMGSSTGGASLTVRSDGDKKGRRRITTTLLETFKSPSSPSCEKATSAAGQPQNSLTGSSSSTAADSAVTSEKSAEVKPRRIQFQTLTSPDSDSASLKSTSDGPQRVKLETLLTTSAPSQQGSCDPGQKSCDSTPRSCDPGSTHLLSHTSSVVSGTDVEPMDTQTVE